MPSSHEDGFLMKSAPAYHAAMERRHIPVLMQPILEVLNLRPGQTVVDCTLGLGGHAQEMLRRITPGGRLIGTDLDPAHVHAAREALALNTGGVFQLFNSNFAGLPAVLAEAGAGRADAILADVGVASPQLDDPARGFSYRRPGPLDMRMDPTRGRPAAHWVNTMPPSELAQALRELGDEDDADQIAWLIADRRKAQPIETTQQLTAIVCEARDFTLKRAAGAKLHPAARTFQALRILTNRELSNLDRLLAVLPDCLTPGGVVAIISFHSGEDRRVKQAFREGTHAGIYCETSPDPIMATEQEQRDNPRARSAKLRWAKRAM